MELAKLILDRDPYLCGHIIHGTEIPQKLLARNMKEEEYSAYLKGIKPVSIWDDSFDGKIEFYISQTKKDEKEKSIFNYVLHKVKLCFYS